MKKPICPICSNEMQLDKNMTDWSEFFCPTCYEYGDDGIAYDLCMMVHNNGTMEWMLAVRLYEYLAYV